MKKRLISIGRAVLFIALFIFCFYLADKNKNLQNQINALNGSISVFQGNIDSIYANVDNMLKKQASLFTDIQSSFSELNADSRTVTLSLSVIPKTVSADTEISVSFDGKSVTLKRDSNKFTGSIDIDIFADEYSPVLTVKSNGEEKTEIYEDIITGNMYQNYLPSVYVNAVFSDSSSVELDFTVEKAEAEIRSAFVVEELNGKEVAKKDVTAIVTSSDAVKHSEYKFNSAVKKNDDLKLYIVVTDSLGYTQKSLIFHNKSNENEFLSLNEDYIYDKDGNMIYGNTDKH